MSNLKNMYSWEIKTLCQNFGNHIEKIYFVYYLVLLDKNPHTGHNESLDVWA